MIAAHLLGLGYNLPRRQWFDAVAHGAGIVAALTDDPFAHAAIAIYDGWATVQHAREAML